MINWNALHEACVDRLSISKKGLSIGISMCWPNTVESHIKLVSRHEALLEFIDTRIQTINKAKNHEIHR